MRIKKNKSIKSILKLIFLVIPILAILALLVYLPTLKPMEYLNAKPEFDIEVPTKLNKRYNYEDIITNKLNRVYSDSTHSIHYLKHFGAPSFLYVYEGEVKGRSKTDLFFINTHFYDTKKILEKTGKSILKISFEPDNAIVLKIKNRTYTVFEKSIFSPFFKLDNISFIYTGRYKFKIPFNQQKVNKVKFKLNKIQPEIVLVSSLDNVKIEINERDFNKISTKRDEALKNMVLISSDKDIVKCNFSINGGNKISGDIRLKGDWTDHLVHDKKWSFRIVTDGIKTANRMRKFSIQHPKARNYMWEWLFNKVVKDNDLLGLRYDFVNTTLSITNKNGTQIRKEDLGIMAFEEAFDKILIENNARREGLIIGFDESNIWKERSRTKEWNVNDRSQSRQLLSVFNAPIKVFNQNKVLSDPKLSKQFNTAKDLLDGLRQKELKISEVFDIDKLTTYVALINLFGGFHGLISHNLRMYYNPITNKLEPVSFDSNSGTKLEKMINYPMVLGDKTYQKLLREKLELVSSTAFVQNILDKYDNDIQRLNRELGTEFQPKFDVSILEYNSNFIKKKINPVSAIVPALINFSNESIVLDVKNLADYPLEILHLEHKDGKILSKFKSGEVIAAHKNKLITIELKDAFLNAFVSKKNKIGAFQYPKDVQKLLLSHSIVGIKYIKKEPIVPYGKSVTLKEKLKNYSSSFEPNFENLPFITVYPKAKKIILKQGTYNLNQTVVIPAGYIVAIEKGFTLDLKSNASFISYSNVIANGTFENPIRFISSDTTGGGIFVTEAKEKSILSHCYFSDLSNPTNQMWELSGAVNFHETNVTFNKCTFENNRCEDGLNVIRSDFTLNSSKFINTFSDSFDGDFVKGKIINCEFINSGNDGIDVSGSNIFLKNITIKNSMDKAISGGEGSTITGEIIRIIGGEIGVVSKDMSNIYLKDLEIENARLAFSCFQKKSEYGIGNIEVNNYKLITNEVDYLIETGSKLLLNKKYVETVSNNVIEQMYGGEYGKSSK